MIVNGDSSSAVNNFGNVPMIPNQIVDALLDETSQEAEDFWKLLYYSTQDALYKPNLTKKEKIKMVWAGDSIENNYHVFYN